MAPFAAAIFLSAFLLFLVQPLLGRYILPWYGGTPAAWSVALLFFQCALLAGYAYAHAVNRFFTPRVQAGVHAGLLLLAALTLPIIPAETLKPEPSQDPALSILWLLLRTAGLPFIALAATGPLLQAWMARLRPGKPPWIMYALSNVGSLGALLSYPFLIEPWLGRGSQAVSWSVAFVVFALLSVACALLAVKRRPEETKIEPGPPPGIARRVVWIALAACGVWMLMAVTNRMTLDLAPVPFLWVMPLALYLLTFVVTFSGESRYSRAAAMMVLPASLAALAWASSTGFPFGIVARTGVFAFGLTGFCWTLHGELFRLRPDVSRLTGYYLGIAFGGALGGACVGLIAPRLLPMYWEFEIGQALGIVAILAAVAIDQSGPLYRFKPAWAWLLIGVALLLWAETSRWTMARQIDNTLMHTRSFFGVTRVKENDVERWIVHGTTTHGLQLLDPDTRNQPVSYYGPSSGIGRVLASQAENRHIGVLGLGAGTIAAWGNGGDRVRFYEIDDEVHDIAREWFTFLEDSAADIEVVIGDGRLMLEREESQQFDVLALDAFASDSIPVHLLTLEAFELYLRHLKPDGVLAVHITNHYVDLTTVVAAAAKHYGLHWTLIDDSPWQEEQMSTDWAIMGRDKDALEALDGEFNPETKDNPPWTDDYSNLFRVLK